MAVGGGFEGYFWPALWILNSLSLIFFNKWVRKAVCIWGIRGWIFGFKILDGIAKISDARDSIFTTSNHKTILQKLPP